MSLDGKGCDGNMDPMRGIWLAGLWLWCCHRRLDSLDSLDRLDRSDPAAPPGAMALRKRSFQVFMENMWRIFGQVEAAIFSIRI